MLPSLQGSHGALTPTPPVSKLPCQSQSQSHNDTHNSLSDRIVQSTGPRGVAPDHPKASATPPITPKHALHTCLRALAFCRLWPLVPGSEELRRPWGTGAAGRGAPGLIGEPRNNEGWKAGGLIGPRSDLAFVWGKAPPRFPQLNSGSQVGPGGALGGRLREGTCAGEGETGKSRAGGNDSPNCARDLGPLDALDITPPHQGAAATTRRECGRNDAALPCLCSDPPRVAHCALGSSRRSRSVLPPGVSSPLRRLP